MSAHFDPDESLHTSPHESLHTSTSCCISFSSHQRRVSLRSRHVHEAKLHSNKCGSGRAKYGLSFDDSCNSKQMSCSYFAVYDTLALHPRLTSAHFKVRTMSAFQVCAIAMPESQKWANEKRRKSEKRSPSWTRQCVCASFMTNRCHASDFAHETFFLDKKCSAQKADQTQHSRQRNRN